MCGGIFATWQPEYAKYGIATFPVGPGKKPSIRGYLKIGLRASERIVQQFPTAMALGLALGRRSGLAVLDVDTNDERLLRECLVRHGRTPIVIRTASGNFQAWYKHNGEHRYIRPNPDLPVDILGAGFVVAPPSHLSGRSYRFIEGSLNDLAKLPVMQAVATSRAAQKRSKDRIGFGSRNQYLFHYALAQASYVDDQDTLRDVVQTENDNACLVPLDDEEVARLAASAWRYETQGRNLVGTRYVPASFAEIDDLSNRSPDAFALLMMLRRQHWGRAQFVVANAFAKKLGWSLPRFRMARQLLEDRGYIHCLHRGGIGKGDPPVYCLRDTKSCLNK